VIHKTPRISASVQTDSRCKKEADECVVIRFHPQSDCLTRRVKLGGRQSTSSREGENHGKPQLA